MRVAHGARRAHAMEEPHAAWICRTKASTRVPRPRPLGFAGLSRRGMTQPIRILGIDPGLRRTGWGVIDVAGNRLSYVACGSVETDERTAVAERLVVIHDGLKRVIDEFHP